MKRNFLLFFSCGTYFTMYKTLHGWYLSTGGIQSHLPYVRASLRIALLGCFDRKVALLPATLLGQRASVSRRCRVASFPVATLATRLPRVATRQLHGLDTLVSTSFQTDSSSARWTGLHRAPLLFQKGTPFAKHHHPLESRAWGCVLQENYLREGEAVGLATYPDWSLQTGSAT